jgi:hypothetical protein
VPCSMRLHSPVQITSTAEPTCSCLCGGLSVTMMCCSGLLRGLWAGSRARGDRGLESGSRPFAEGDRGQASGCAELQQLGEPLLMAGLPAESAIADAGLLPRRPCEVSGRAVQTGGLANIHRPWLLAADRRATQQRNIMSLFGSISSEGRSAMQFCSAVCCTVCWSKFNL